MTAKFRITKPEYQDIPAITDLLLEQEDLHHALDPEWYAERGAAVAKKVQKELESMLRYGKTRLLVAKTRGKLVGFCTFAVIRDDYHNAVQKRFGEVYEIYLDKKHRNMGIGKAFIQSAEEYFQTKGIFHIMIRCSSFNKDAAGFYAHLGYRDVTMVRSKDLTPQISPDTAIANA